MRRSTSRQREKEKAEQSGIFELGGAATKKLYDQYKDFAVADIPSSSGQGRSSALRVRVQGRPFVCRLTMVPQQRAAVTFVFALLGVLLILQCLQPAQHSPHGIPSDPVAINTNTTLTGRNIPSCGPHVVFTTFTCTECDPLRRRIEQNTRHIWSTMEDVDFRVIAANETATNEYGLPILGDMYLRMMESCPDAQTYTYTNGDILGDHRGFVETINAAFKLGDDFLITGRRTNVPWKEVHDATQDDFDFDAHLNRGELFNSLAQDYFTVTKDAIQWKKIPKFVIGRVGYDNWLVAHVAQQPNVALIDATQTNRMIHQTGEDGIFASGGVQDGKDKTYNKRLAKPGESTGTTDDAEWETARETVEGGGSILIRHRKWKVVVRSSSVGALDFGEFILGGNSSILD